MATTDIDQSIEQRGINVIRGLAMDAVQKANSGHPGTPMALAPLAHVLWTRIMQYDAAAPDWPDRDRFVLSNGHASMLLYSHALPHRLRARPSTTSRRSASGVARRPATPSTATPPGVEVTTGPLGQGFANGVGIGLAEANLRARFGPEVVDHHMFVFCGDGDLEEGVSHEAASLAGHLGLGRLVYVYDDNHITIDGPTELAVQRRRPEALRGLRLARRASSARSPTTSTRSRRASARAWPRRTARACVILRSHIGYPSPKYTDTAHAHGNPLGADEVAAVKEILGLPPEDFFVPDDVLAYYRAAGARGRAAREAWEQRRAAFRDARARARRRARRLPRAARARRAGRRSSPSWKAGEDGRHPPGVHRGRQRDPRRRARAARAAAPTSPRTPARSSKDAAGRSTRTTSAAASSTSASASTAWARS